MHELISQFLRGLQKYPEAIQFIRKHRLWEGFERYKIVVWVLLAGAAYLGFRMMTIFRQKMAAAEDDVVSMGTQFFSAVSSVFEESYAFLFAGSYRYLIFLLLEVLIFHFAVRTVEVLSGKDFKLTVSVFVKAQIRMFKLVVFNFAIELIIAALLGIVLGIIGMGWLKAFFMFFVQCFLMGFLVIDNFNEIQGSGIRTSFKRTKKYLGAAIGLGLPIYLIMFVPVIGTIVGPLLGVVASSLLMFELEPDMLQEEVILEEEMV